MIEDEVLLIVLTVIAAVVCVPLSFLADGLLMQHGLPTPGLYVWGWLHPHPQPGFLGPDLGSLLGTEMVVDSVCWFMVLMVTALLIDRAVKRKKRLG